MSTITAQMVANLREITGLGMMDCKKALVETNGDIQKAVELIRVKSGAKAGKMAGRITAEGSVAVHVSADGKKCALVEVNCETDFVAKDEKFLTFANNVANAVVETSAASLEDIANAKTKTGKTVEEERKELISQLGENITVRRFELFNTKGTIATYLHGNKVGVVVDFLGGDQALGKDLAMHIAALKPICVSKDNVPAEKIEAERSIYIQQAEGSGKPAEIVAKMVEGRVNKFLAEITLLGQQFVKNSEISVEKLLADNKAHVNTFAMFVVGEGVEKKVVDYAAEVAAAAKIN